MVDNIGNPTSHPEYPDIAWSCLTLFSRVLEREKLKSVGFQKKLSVGEVLDFTSDFGLKVCQVSAGFGCGERYYCSKMPQFFLSPKSPYFLAKKVSELGDTTLYRLFDPRGREIVMKKGEEKVIVTDVDFEWPERVKLNVEEIAIAGLPTPVFVLCPNV